MLGPLMQRPCHEALMHARRPRVHKPLIFTSSVMAAISRQRGLHNRCYHPWSGNSKWDKCWKESGQYVILYDIREMRRHRNGCLVDSKLTLVTAEADIKYLWLCCCVCFVFTWKRNATTHFSCAIHVEQRGKTRKIHKYLKEIVLCPVYTIQMCNFNGPFLH